MQSSYFSLHEAIKRAREGCFVSNTHFDSSESMHYWNGKLYYEEGAVVTEEFLSTQAFASGCSWYVKYEKEKVNIGMLNDMHKRNTGYTLSSGSYEDCIYRN